MAYDGTLKFDTSINSSAFQNGLNKIGTLAKKALSAVTTAVTGISAALGAGAVAGVKYNSQMEQYYTSFETMLGSAEKAQDMVGKLKKFAAETPFEMSDIAKGTQTLLSFGISADKVMPTIKMLGDVSQGNKEKFDSLTLAFSQIQSTGKLMGQDLLQLINAGFNPLTIISQKTGKSMAQLKKEMADGSISADMVADAFKTATEKGGLFYNAMEKQSKTFNGQLSTLKDNAKSFLGEITEGFTNGLKDTALPMVNGWLTDLSDAFHEGGTEGLVKEIGMVLSEAALEGAKRAPGIIKSAVLVIQSFVEGIKENSGQLLKAATSIVNTLADGIISLLPKSLQRPIKNALKDIQKSFESGGLKKAIQTFGSFLSNVIKTVSKLGRSILPALTKAVDFLGKHLDKILPTITGAYVAFKSWKIITTVTSNVKKFASSVSDSISDLKGFISKLNGAEGATGGFSSILKSLSGSGGAIALAVGAAVGLGTVLFENIEDPAKKAREEMEELQDTVEGSAESWMDVRDATKEQLSVNDAEIKSLQSLWDELQSIVDQNGKVKAGQEERAQFIINELNDALGTEISMNGNVIDSYKAVAGSIDKVIEKKKASLKLSAYDDQYEEAQKQLPSLYETQANLYSQIEKAKRAVAEAEKEEKKALEANSVLYADKHAKADEARNNLESLTEAYRENAATITSQVDTINKVETANKEMIKGNYAGVEQALNTLNIAYKASTGATKEELSQQAIAMYKNYKFMRDNVNVAGLGITQDMVKNARETALQASVEYGVAAKSAVGGFITGLDENGIPIYEAAKDVTSNVILGAQAGASVAASYQQGGNFIQGFIDGMEQMKLALAKKAADVVGVVVNIGSQVLQEHSPSKVAQRQGVYYGEGMALGLENSRKDVKRAAAKLANATIETTTSMLNKMNYAIATQRSVFSSPIAAQVQYEISSKMQPISSSPVYNQTVNIQSQEALSPAETARQTRHATQQLILSSKGV